MGKIVCYPTTRLDKQIAQDERFQKAGYVPAMIATLRAVYDSRHAIPFAPDTMSDEEVISERLDTLFDFYQSLREKDRKTVSNTGNMYASAFQALIEGGMSSMQRREAADIISQIFSQTVKEIMANTKQSKAEVCRNEFDIFERVYDKIDELIDDESISDKDADFLETVLDNFGALSVYSRVVLKSTENIILGSTKSYAAKTTDENWEDIIYTDFYEAEESTKESWQEASNLKSAYSRVGEYTRVILSSIPSGKEIAGIKLRYDGQKVHQHLTNLFRGMRNSNRMLDILRFEASEGDTIAQAVLEKLNENPLFQRCMYTSMKHGFTLYGQTGFSKSDSQEGAIFILNNKSNNYFSRLVYSITSGLTTENSLFKKNNVTGDVYVDIAELKKLKADSSQFTFNTGASTFASVINNIFSQQQNQQATRHKQLANLTKLVSSHLQKWGISYQSDTITKLLHQAKSRTKLLKAFKELYESESLATAISIAEEFEQPIVASKFLTEATETTGSVGYEKTSAIKVNLSKICNLIEEVEQNNKYPSTARAMSKKGKQTTIHSETPPCFLTDYIDPIVSLAEEGKYDEIRELLISKYQNNPYFYNKETGQFQVKWLQDIVKSKDHDVADNFIHLRTVQHKTKNGTIISTDSTSESHKWQMLFDMYSHTNGTAYDSKYAWYPTFVLGDSGALRWIKAPKYDINTIIEEMYNIFKQECLLKDQIENINSKITTGSKIKFGNEDGTISAMPFLSYSDRENLTKDDIISKIKAYYTQKTEDNIHILETLGLLSISKEGVLTDLGKMIPKSRRNNIHGFVTEMTFNSAFAQMQQFQLMTVSTSFYKDSVDLQKRYKEINASGSAMDVFGCMVNEKGEVVPIFPPSRMSPEGAFEKVIYFKDIVIDPKTHKDFIDLIDRVNPKAAATYRKDGGSSLTDGQGYRTLASYRQIAMAQGRWDEKGPEELIWRWTQQLKDPSISESKRQELISKIKNSNIVFQPEKPFLFTHERLNSSVGREVTIPVQHKCSEIVLIPEILPEGSNLQSLAYAMEELGIDAAYSSTVVKVGLFGETDLASVHDRQGMKDMVSKAVAHNLNLSNYYRQQNVPEHVNHARQLGTQIRKTPFINLDLTGKIQYDYFDRLPSGKGIKLTDTQAIDNPRNGVGLMQFYNALICANIFQDFKKFITNIKDIPGLSAQMQQTIIANSRNTLDSLMAYSLTADNQFLMPLFEAGVEHDAVSLMLSWFRKNVLSQKMAGGAAVQASAYGLTAIETDETDVGKLGYKVIYDKNGNPTNIEEMEAELSWDLSYTDASGKQIDLEYEKYCDKDGNLLTNSKGEILLDIDYPGIRNIVAYRIPTENNYSIMNITVTRFSPKINGGIIKLPFEGTKTAGFDFDIDKLYLIRKEFKSKELQSEQVHEIWRSLYQDNQDIFRTLLQTRNKIENIEDDIDSLLSKYFAKSELAIKIIEGRNNNRKLYEYWEEAGLTLSTGMSYTEFFESYYNEHKKDFGFEEFDQYDYNRAIDKQSKTAINNEILSIIQHRLADPTTLESRTTPGGFETASVVGKLMRILESGNPQILNSDGTINQAEVAVLLASKDKFLEKRDPTDLATYVAYHQQNQVAGALIGIFANHNTNNMYAKMAHAMTIKDPKITINGKTLNDLIHSDVNTIQTLAELLAASVDAVKDPVLNYFNLNVHTADTAAMLGRLGYSLEEIGLFLKQPIIVELCEMLANNDRETMDSASKRLIKKYGDSLNGIQDVRMAATTDIMQENIHNYAKAKREGKQSIESFFAKNGANQRAILQMFLEAQPTVAELRGFISMTKFTAANSVGSTAGDVYASLYKAQKYANKDPEKSKLEIVLNPIQTKLNPLDSGLSFTNFSEYIQSIASNPFAFEQCMYDAFKNAFLQMCTSHLPYETHIYKYNREYLNQISKTQALDAETINKFHNFIYKELLQTLEGSIFDPNLLTADGETTYKDYYLNEFPSDIRRVLAEEEFSGNLTSVGKFIKEFLVVYSNTSGQLILDAKDNMQMTTDRKNDFMEQLENVANSSEEGQAFAKDLFRYSFFKSGFTFGFESFGHLLPSFIKANMPIGQIRQIKDGRVIMQEVSYTDYLREIQQGSIFANYRGADIVKRFLLENIDNSQFAARFYNAKDLNVAGINQSEDKSAILISPSELSDKDIAYRKIVWGTQDNPRFAPIIVSENNIYLLQNDLYSNSEIFTETSSSQLIYAKVGQLSEKGVLQLDESSAGKESQEMSNVDTSTSQADTEEIISVMAQVFSDSVEAAQHMSNTLNGGLQRLVDIANKNPESILDSEGNESEIC